MLKEEFDRLMGLFEEASQGNQVNVEEIFRQSIGFFERLKERIAKGSSQEKIEAIHLMTQMYQKMMAETSKIAKHTGMSEEQLMAYASNPGNFNKEQWEHFQSAQSQLKHLGEEIVQEMKHAAAPPAIKHEEHPKTPSAKKTGKEKGVKKADWFRS